MPAISAELTALIRMDHDRSLRLASPNNHQQSTQGQFAIQSRSHRPPGHLPRKQVKNRSQGQPTLVSTDVSDVRDPDFIELSDIELPLQAVRRQHKCKTAAFKAALAITCLRIQVGGTHDAVHTIDPALLAEITQDVRDLPVAVHRTAFQSRLLDGPEQAFVHNPLVSLFLR